MLCVETLLESFAWSADGSTQISIAYAIRTAMRLGPKRRIDVPD
jgi:hypothetical protein